MGNANLFPERMLRPDLMIDIKPVVFLH